MDNEKDEVFRYSLTRHEKTNQFQNKQDIAKEDNTVKRAHGTVSPSFLYFMTYSLCTEPLQRRKMGKKIKIELQTS